MASLQTSRGQLRVKTCVFIQTIAGHVNLVRDWLRDQTLSALSSWPGTPKYHTSQIEALPEISNHISSLAINPNKEMYRDCIIGVIMVAKPSA